PGWSRGGVREGARPVAHGRRNDPLVPGQPGGLEGSRSGDGCCTLGAMDIIGGGLLASGFRPHARAPPGAILFSSGVSDSSCTDPAQFDRELDLLSGTLRSAEVDGRRLVYMSSAPAVYGRWSGAIDETGARAPSSPYGRHKVACEAMVASAAGSHL